MSSKDSIATAVSSKDFFSTWEHALQSNFAKDNQPATYFPGHPKRWGEELTRINGVKSIALNDNGSLLGVSNGGEIQLYDMPSMTLWRTLKGFEGQNNMTITFQPGHDKDGIMLVGVTDSRRDRIYRRVFKWYKLGDKEVDVDGNLFDEAAESAASVAAEIISKKSSLSRDDIDLSTLHQRIRDVLSSTILQPEMQKGDVIVGHGMSFSRDGSFLLYIEEENTVVVVDSRTRQERFTLTGHTNSIMWAETSPDDSVIATSSWDRTVRIWNATNGQELRVLTGAENQCWSGAFSPDGNLISVGAGDSKVRVWNVENGDLLYTFGGFKDWVRNLAFSPDGKSLAAGSGRGTLKVFDLTSGEEKQNWQVKVQNLGFVEILHVNYTSKGLLVFGYADGRVFTYDQVTNQMGQFEHEPDRNERLPGHGKKLVTPDGNLLISEDFDGNVRIWRLE
ncbi:WD40 repeat-like protein [Dendrothele bispora CBS 962.96]|uniref:WD40 repeat-like protein n=1 Tax=Dendrothele bispora (strain CBS 962.96) TaxID=1314807 RepID=A0A4S8MFF2_DENBC|nr:WD40 repeat-like protein [Dendrothele bispora CBS 962.96]